MGTDKAALVHPDGRPLGRRTVDLLAAADCSKVLVSLRHDQPVPPEIPDSEETGIVRDPAGGSCGPLAGILAAMRLHPEAGWLVAACDLPRLDLATLRHLTASRLPDDMFLAFRSESDGLPEPLCAFYAAGALPILQQAVDDGFRCPRKILIRHHCRLLDPIVPRALENANTAADWQTAQCP
jgi:molybdopterin-guanine dinucleotide biosynthesis protein A